MSKELLSLVSGEVLEEDVELTLVELCQACQMQAEQLFDLVEQGVIEPLGQDPARWRFRGTGPARRAGAATRPAASVRGVTACR